MIYGICDISRNMVGMSSNSSILRKDEFWSINNVSFHLEKGEVLGVLGANGAGKTTMLKMINSIFWPDKGKISIRGRVGAMIEVSSGFHPLLTGRENIYVKAAIMGMNKKEVDAKFDAIVKFADIGSFLDVPVKHYSSGMSVRLGFSVAVHGDPDILLVDEVLAVGDMAFRSKCYKKISELRKKTSIIIVSHYMPAVQNIATKCLVLDKGRQVYMGDTISAISYYYHLLSEKVGKQKNDLSKCYKDDRIDIKNIKVLRNGKEETTNLCSGDSVEFLLRMQTKKLIENPQITITFNADIYTGFCTKYDDFEIDQIQGEIVIRLKIDNLGLGAGIYNVSIGIWDNDMLDTYFWNWEAVRLIINNPREYIGRFEFEHRWEIEKL